MSLVRGKLRREIEGISKRKRTGNGRESDIQKKKRPKDSESEKAESFDEDDHSEEESRDKRNRRTDKREEVHKLAEWDISDIL